MNFNYFFDARTTSSIITSSYHTLISKKDLEILIKSLIKNPFPIKYSKQDLHAIIDNIIQEHHFGELKYKYLLAKKFIEEDSICAFEVKTSSSRIDFIRVNGTSNSYEIKTGLDNLLKLEKQSSDYNKFFENNFIVIDKKHFDKAINIIPINYGIYIVENKDLIKKREAKFNKNLNPVSQLNIFSKKELKYFFNEVNINSIIETHGNSYVNNIFKLMIKKRYSSRWKFLLLNCKEIYSIDYQFFFQKNISPKIIYSI